jgi:DNA-damage-inducible protein J
MATNAKSEFIRARIEPQLKHDAEEILDQLGLSQTEAIRIFYKQIVINKGLPFEVKVPNRTTLKAINDAENNKNIVECSDENDLFGKLNL